MLATQLTASRVLTQVLDGRNLNEALDAALAADPSLTPQQRGAIREACFDTLRHYGLIEAELRALVKTPARQEIDSLLKIALAQLQFGRGKPYAVVDHAVKAAFIRLSSAFIGVKFVWRWFPGFRFTASGLPWFAT